MKSGGRPTRDDVAEYAQISGATVSRVLSGRTDLSISPETRAKVMEAVEKLGYRPNLSARALMTGKTGLVGLWMCLGYSRYRSQVLDQMRNVLASTDLTLAVTDVDEDYSVHHSFSRALRVPVDGIIAFDTSASGETFARNHDLLAPMTPFVSMGAYWSEAKSYVGVDLRAGADEAMAHLLSTGRKRIAYLAPSNSDTISSGARHDGYVAAMRAAGLPTQIVGVKTLSPDDMRRALTECGPMPEALLCMSDDVALCASFVLGQLGKQVGRDVALVGFDGIQETEMAPCPITTVEQPVADMCRLTWQFLQAQIEFPNTGLQQKVLKPKLVIRDSSRS
jgi:DNA-binding LacI/PurR family transcriptional regulator